MDFSRVSNVGEWVDDPHQVAKTAVFAAPATDVKHRPADVRPPRFLLAPLLKDNTILGQIGPGTLSQSRGQLPGRIAGPSDAA